MRDLLTLYKLLWEQIKDEDYVYSFDIELDELWEYGMMSHEDLAIISNHIADNFTGYADERKEFVQRMIKELENKE